MPFKAVTGFEPDTLVLLQRAYDEACALLQEAKGAYPDEKTRTALAQVIVQHAMKGERDFDKLTAFALAEVG